MMKAVIPVAGRGTRLLPVTKEVPKELFPILTLPVLHYVVEEALAGGFSPLILVTAIRGKEGIEGFYRPDGELEAFLRERGQWEELRILEKIHAAGSEIIFVKQPEPLGLGHALLCARDFIEEGESFGVLLGDDLTVGHPTPVIEQLRKVSGECGGASVLGVMEVCSSQAHLYGMVSVGKEVKSLEKGPTFGMEGMVEKPGEGEICSNLACMGRYILPSTIFKILDNLPLRGGEEIQLTDGINELCLRGKSGAVLAHCFSGERYDVGTPRGYLEALLEFALRGGGDLREYTIDSMKAKLEKYD